MFLKQKGMTNEEFMDGALESVKEYFDQYKLSTLGTISGNINVANGSGGFNTSNQFLVYDDTLLELNVNDKNVLLFANTIVLLVNIVTLSNKVDVVIKLLKLLLSI